MSYNIRLADPVNGQTLQFDTPHQMKGGTYALDGTCEAWLNVTYNYARWYNKDGVFPANGGIRAIYGMSGAQSIPVLEHGIQAIKGMDELDGEEIKKYEANSVTGYWIPTKSNAVKPLYQLLAMAQMRPDGVWDGD